MKIFVIMPFDDELKEVYEQLIKAPLIAAGHKVSRADDVNTHDYIPRRIIENIRDYDVIIADLTGQNANVYYELGIAHTLDRPTIHIVQDYEELAFDIKPYNAIKYSTLFHEAPKLTKGILEIISRADRGEFSFSNPVKDSIGSDFGKKNLVTPPENIEKDEEEVADDSDEPGLLDSIVLAEESLVAIGEITAEMTEPMNVLSAKTREHKVKSDELNASPHVKGLNSKRLQIARGFAADLNVFSDAVKERIPRLNESWNTLDQSIGYVLSVGTIQNESEVESIQANVIDSTENLQETLRSGLDTFESLRDAHNEFPSLSRATNRAIRNSERTLEKLCDEYRLGDSVLTRIIILANEMIDRYYVDNPDNGDSPSS